MDTIDIDEKIRKVTELVDKKNYYVEKKKVSEFSEAETETYVIQDDQKLIQKKLKNEKIKNRFLNGLTGFKIGRNERKIRRNIQKLEGINREVEELSLQANRNEELLAEKIFEITNQSNEIIAVKDDIKKINIKIENSVHEISAKQKIIKFNKKVEKELVTEIKELRTDYEKKLSNIGTVKKSLEWQNAFLKEKENEKSRVEKSILVQEEKEAESRKSITNIKQKVSDLNKQLAVAIKKKEVQEENLAVSISKQQDQALILDGANDLLSKEMGSYDVLVEKEALINSSYEQLKQKIENINSNRLELDFKKKEIEFLLMDKEKEHDQTNLLLISTKSRFQESGLLLETKQNKYRIVKDNTDILKSKLTQVKDKIANYEIKLREVDENKKQLLEQGRTYTAKLNSLRPELIMVQEELAVRKSELEELATETTILSSEVVSVTDRVGSTRRNLYIIETEYKELVEARNSEVKAQNEAESRYIVVQNELHDMKRKVLALSKERDELKQINSELSQKVDNVKHTVKDCEQEAIKLNNDVFELENLKKGSLKSIEKLEDKLKLVRSQILEASDVITKNELESEEIRSEKVELEIDVNNAESRLKEIDILINKEKILINEEQEKLDVLGKNIKAAERTVLLKEDLLAKNRDGLNALKRDLKNKGKELSNMLQNCKQIDSFIGKSEREKGEITVKLEKLQAVILKTEQTKLGLSTDLDENLKRVSYIKNQENKLEEKLKSLNGDIAGFESGIRQLKSKIQDSQENCMKIDADIEYANENILKNRQYIEKKESELLITAGLFKSKRAEHGLIDKRLRDLLAQLPLLESKDSKFKTELDQVEQSINELVRKTVEKNGAIDELNLKINKTTKEHFEKTQEVEELESELIHLDNRINYYESEFRIQDERELFLERQYESMSSKVNAKEAELKLMEVLFVKRNSEIATTRNRLEKEKRTLKELSAKSVQLQSEVVKQDSMHDLVTQTTQMPPLPVRTDQVIKTIYSEFVNMMRYSYGNIHFLSKGTKDEDAILDKEIELKNMINLFIDYVGGVDKVIIGHESIGIYIQFEAKMRNIGEFSVEEFQKVIKSEVSLGASIVTKLVCCQGMVLGTVILKEKDSSKLIQLEA